MLNTLELDYVQHLERGYCVNHPDVVDETKEQVVDRAVKQLLEALQANGFELDGNILKRGDGWLRYDVETSKWQYSNDGGETWAEMGSGGGGGVPWADMGRGLTNTISFGESVAIGASADGYSLEFTESGGQSWQYFLDNSHLSTSRHNGLMLINARPFLGAAISTNGVATFLMSTGAYNLGTGLQGYRTMIIAQTTGAITITGATYRLGAAAGTTLYNDYTVVGDFCEMLYSDGTDSINGGWWILANRGSWAVG